MPINLVVDLAYPSSTPPRSAVATSRSLRLRRRGLLGIPALLAAAFTVVGKPAPARAAKRVECLADLIEES